MRESDSGMSSTNKCSRRNFLATAGAAAAGLLMASSQKAKNLYAVAPRRTAGNPVKVAVTEAYNYDRATVKQRVQHLFEALGGIGDVVKAGDKVAIKINLTGGVGIDNHKSLNGVPLIESMWTHPEVIRAVGELLMDSGVRGSDIYLVESLWDTASYNSTKYGYLAVQQSLGAQLVNLDTMAPYTSFINKSVGPDYFYFSSFQLNRILDEVNVFISIPKMKQHRAAAVTHSMKNLVGMVPRIPYELGGQKGWRSQLHFHFSGGNINTNLPRSICDLNMARPIHLAVIDGIKNSEGGEVPYDSVFFHPTENHLLLAGKDPVALDSIASLQMGNDPEGETLRTPSGGECDNYLYLANEKGMGTNVLSEIQLVGDGADAITSVKKPEPASLPDRIVLSQNFPNPFNPSTIIRYYVPRPVHATLKIFNSLGQEIETLVNDFVSAGEHERVWIAKHLPSGVYYCRLQVGRSMETQKLMLQK